LATRADSPAIRVSMGVEYRPAWLTWVAATTTYVPEFGVVVGLEDESYEVKTFKEVLHQQQPSIRYDETVTPGGIYALGFPAAAEHGELQRDLESVLEALRLWAREEGTSWPTGMTSRAR
jgi:hypothetical protein